MFSSPSATNLGPVIDKAGWALTSWGSQANFPLKQAISETVISFDGEGPRGAPGQILGILVGMWSEGFLEEEALQMRLEE